MICVDASLVAKWLFPEEHSEQALALVAASVQAGRRIVAPTLLPIEITNIIRRRMLRDGLNLSDAKRLLAQYYAFSIAISAPEGLQDLALALADAHNLPAVYDAYYVTLAQLLGCELWTSDRRLLRALGGKLPFVKWIGDWKPSAD